MPTTALLIDDEAPARRRLARLLEAHAADVTVVGEAGDVPSARAALRRHRPDVLFLDVEMPGADGFALLRSLAPEERPHVVFVTAYAAYAVDAFEAQALDYLVKPVEPDRLAQTVARLRTRSAPAPVTAEALERLAAQLRPEPPMTTLPVRTGDRYVFVALDDVTHFEARDKYVFAHTVDGAAHLLDHGLAALAEKLPPAFVQVHRSLVVHRRHVASAQRLFSGKYRLRLATRPAVTLDTGPSFAGAVEAMLQL